GSGFHPLMSSLRASLRGQIIHHENAGHNPPLIFRKGCGVIRLDVGGPVVGLLPAFPYRQAALELESGDLFVSFTDGISEAMNAADQEWGEDRLIDQAWKSAGLSAAENYA